MGAPQKQTAPPAADSPLLMIFAGAAGLFFFVSVIKFGDPVILQNIITAPDGWLDALFESWPVKIGYWLLVPVLLTGLATARWGALKFKWPLALPLLWLGWQFLASTQTVSPALTSATVMHFSVCVVLFYLGYFSLARVRHPWPVWTGLALALCWVIRSGFEQHFGGLEATRQMVEQMKNDPSMPPGLLTDPAYLKRIASNRIFATFSTPDAFAAGIELLLPVTLLFLWKLTPKVRPAVRGLFVTILGGCGLVCLYWTGSKGAWLVSLLMAAIALIRSTLPIQTKRNLIVAVTVLGLTVFGYRYATSYKKQQVSVGTRVAYWKAAARIAAKHPVLGTGPGTFSIPYEQVKRPEDDFAKLCHNDYLEQACDSGFPGFLAFAAMIVGCLAFSYHFRIKKTEGYSYYFVLWLGVFGVCLHNVVDYNLYFPALAWPMFFFLGFCVNSER